MGSTAHPNWDAEATREQDGREIELIAATLRAERRRDGDPTLSALSIRTGISKSALSEAFSGRRLPSVRTIETLADDLGFDPAPIVTKRRAVQERMAARARVGEAGEPQPPRAAREGVITRTVGSLAQRISRPGRGRYSGRTLVLAGLTGLLIGAASVGSIAWRQTRDFFR